ncbi:hypothetical protein AMBAS45_16425 [Alteromonas macleodii str. 'Balearic Sea AD45']|uniref:hypothetical protein n=1 Tax=Alteromonas macleodii TaxID=28108 RepID=UPI000286FE8C|nr:hypothetical protein [Alteromonas macleodii]AFT96746.1 hypothetical protein AMBAS45_16425 [Alteromonas macleodii str. 'Balearic Sea AD45']
MSNKISTSQLAFELSLQFGAIVNIQDLAHFFGFKSKLDKEYIDALKQRGLKIFKLADSNKAPHLVLMYDFLEFIKSQSYEQ